MKGFVRRMEDVFTALAFSEVGEQETAREFFACPAASTRLKVPAEIHSRPHIPLVPEGDP